MRKSVLSLISRRVLPGVVGAWLFANTAMAFDVQGHRGARAVLPENSLPAFEYALALGVDTLELDMGVTKDGHVVVIHDQKLNPSICQTEQGGKIKSEIWVHQITLAQLQGYDCGARQHPKFLNQKVIPGTKVPTLDEVFSMVTSSSLPQAKTVRFNIETKSRADRPQAQPDPTDFIAVVLKVVDKYKLRQRVTIQSFDHRTLVAAKALDSSLITAALFRENPGDWVKAAKAAKADIILPKFTLLTKQNVKKMQAAGFPVIPWTPNKKLVWEELIKMGVDGIITDDPAQLMVLLGRLDAPPLVAQ